MKRTALLFCFLTVYIIGYSQATYFPSNTSNKPTTQFLSSTGTATNWNSVVTVGNASANVTTLPVINAEDVGKTITIKNVNTGANTQLPPAGATIVGGVSLANGEAVTFFAYDLTTIQAISRKN